MKLAIVAATASLIAVAHAQDTERDVPQLDRVCLGRMLIVQTMAHVKDGGQTEEQYRERNPYPSTWTPAMRAEVDAVVTYVWSHSFEDNMQFASAAMAACYEKHAGV